MNTIVANMEPSSKNGLTIEQKNYAISWLKQDLKLRDPIVVDTNDLVKSKQHQGIKFIDYFKEIDKSIEASIENEIEESQF